MARRVIDISRRQLLLGLGGATLALPVLPSLLSNTAYGADPIYNSPKRLFWTTTNHGGAFESSMFPSQSILNKNEQLFSDHAVRWGDLAAKDENGKRTLSKVLSANSTVLTDQLMAKMNVLMGLDVPFYMGHVAGQHLGNWSSKGSVDAGNLPATPRPTIDQLLAWSKKFYPDLTGVKERSMILGSMSGESWGYSSPEAQSGKIDIVKGESDSLALFDRLFGQQQAMPTNARKPIVDKVLENYKSLRNGNSRLSQNDKQRLDDHIDRINELERRLTTVTSCGDVKRPADNSFKYNARTNRTEMLKWNQLLSDVAVAALICGNSRIAVLAFGETAMLVDYPGDFHQEVAHQWNKDSSQDILVRSYQSYFADFFVNIAAALDVEEVPGSTYLDNSLIVWSQESGTETHFASGMPVVTFGGAGGYFKTGRFVDYRQVENKAAHYVIGDSGGGTSGPECVCGTLYNQWLANVLLSMGMEAKDFELWGHKGYGFPGVFAGNYPPYPSHYSKDGTGRYFQAASDPMLGIT